MSYYSAVFAEGALTEREKALIALAVAHAVQCPYCIDAYTQASLEKGSNVEEMTKAEGMLLSMILSFASEQLTSSWTVKNSGGDEVAAVIYDLANPRA